MNAQIDRSQPKPGPAPQVTIGTPHRFVLDNGLKVLVVENHKLPRIAFDLTLDNKPVSEGDKIGVDELMGSLMGSGTLKTSRDVFVEEIDYLGASIDFHSSGANGSSLSKYGDRVLELLAEGVLQPKFTQDDFDKEKAKYIESLKANEKNVKSIADRVENALVFGNSHPFGEFETEKTIQSLTLSDIQNHYNTFFVPENAYLVIIGDINFKKVKKLIEKQFKNWKKTAAPSVVYTDKPNVTRSEVNFVHVPHAVQSEISVVNTINLPMSSPDYFVGLLANQILGGGGEGRLFLNLREKHGWTYGAYSSFKASKYISKFRVSTSVRNTVTDSAVVEIFNEIKRMRTELVSDEDLKNAKAKFIGNFVMQIEKPQTIARYALNIESQGLPQDFYKNFIKNIEAVTPEDIQRVSQKYFLADNSRVIIVGKADDVLEGLTRLAMPISYYNINGETIDKPEIKKVNKEITAGVVLRHYIDAIGGEAKMKIIKSISTVANGTMQGMELKLLTKVTNQKQLLVDMQMMGNTMMKQVLNKNTGYIIQQGQKMPLKGEMLEDLKQIAHPFIELYLLESSNKITVKGIEVFQEKECYVLKDAKTIYYYEVLTGLKIGQVTEQEVQGKTISQTTIFTDYKAVEGIQIPFTKIMDVGVEIVLKTQSVSFNKNINPADFN